MKYQVVRKLPMMALWLVLALGLTACGLIPGSGAVEEPVAAVDAPAQADAAAPTAEPQPTATVAAAAAIMTGSDITVFGSLEPARTVELSFVRDGQVEEIFVAEGDIVTAGQLLARLRSATPGMTTLTAEADVEAARARLAELQAGPSDEAVAALESQVKAAEARVTAAQADYGVTARPASDADIAAAQAQIAAAEAERRASQINYDRHINEGLLGAAEEIARLQLAASQAAYDAAQANLNALTSGPGSQVLFAASADITEASALVESARAQVALAMASAQPETIAVLEAEVRRAEAALELVKAEAAFAEEQTLLYAPFDGVIVSLDISPLQAVSGAQPVMLLADMEHMRIRATDLDELFVVRVEEGQEVSVTFDALPGSRFTGVVEAISLRPNEGTPATEGTGTSYTVLIALDEADAALRWGMSAAARIHTGSK